MQRLFELYYKAVVVATIGCGGAVMYGWMIRSAPIVQLQPQLAAMQFNTALCFTLLGASMYALHREWRRAVGALSGTAGLIGLLTLLEYACGVNLGIDNLFVTPFISFGSCAPGRMAPNTACCFALIALSLWLSTGKGGAKARAAFPAALALAIAIVALGGYCLHWSSAYTFGRAIPMALHTCIVFVAVTSAILWRQAMRCESPWPEWAPATGGICAFLMTALICQSLLFSEHDNRCRTLEVQATERCLAAELAGQELIDALASMAARGAPRQAPWPREEWLADVEQFQRHFISVSAIGIFNGKGQLVASSPTAWNYAGVVRPVERDVLLPAVKKLPSLRADGIDAALCSISIPMQTPEGLGRLVAVCHVDELLNKYARTDDGVQLKIVDSSPSGPPPTSSAASQIRRAMSIGGERWQVMAEVKQAMTIMTLPIALVLAFGSVQAVLVWMLLRLAARNSAQAIELSEAHERLRLAVTGGNVGAWERNLADDSMTTSAEFNAQLGEPPGAIRTYAEWESRLHPGDVDRARASVHECLQGDAEAYESIIRMKHADGSYRRILSRGCVYRDRAGVAMRMAGTHVDVTQLHHLEQLFQALFNETIQFIGILDPAGIVIEANRAALQAAGVERADVVGKPFWETVWWDHSPALRQRLRDAIAQASQGFLQRFEATHLRPDGSRIVVDFSLKPVRDLGGNVTYLIPEGRDITEYRQSPTDELAEIDDQTLLVSS